jgi:hypothetical protein
MNSKLNLIAAAAIAVLTGSVAAEESYWVALSSDVSMNRTSIANAAQGEKSVWIQRNYDRLIALGTDPKTGQDVAPHRSVRIQYVVNCSQGTVNMVSWRMYRDIDGQGSSVWAHDLPHADASYRHSPGTEEEKAVTAHLCGTSVGSR